MRQIPLLFAALSIVPAAIAQTGLNSLPEVEFAQLSQRDPNPLGERALSINPTQWKHGETEHYIYHFAHSYVATPISVEAEFHYRVVAKELERDQPLTDIKSNVYIFERPEDWQQFQGLGELEKWTGGIHSQGSLFILRNPEQKFSGNLLGHEIVHLVLHRFYADGIPCWLNEGIAQYISKSAHASYQRARGYISKPHSEATDQNVPRTFRSSRYSECGLEMYPARADNWHGRFRNVLRDPFIQPARNPIGVKSMKHEMDDLVPK